MGVDAEILVRVKRDVSDDEVRALRAALVGAFGKERFCFFEKDEIDHSIDPPDEGCLHRIYEFFQDGPTLVPEPGETFLRVYPNSRFYGIGYERGDLPFLLALARFLRDKTGGQVWYGGDSSGECARWLHEGYERELWDHFVQNGHAS